MPADPKAVQADLFSSSVIGTANGLPKPKVERAPVCEHCKNTYLSDREVAKRFNISKATVWRWNERNPDFPKRIKLSPGTSRWRLFDLVEFEKNLKPASAPANSTKV